MIFHLIRKHQLTALFTILTSQSSAFNLSELGISSLFHNIILLRYVEAKSKMKRSMLILKMRATRHDESILEFVITDNGIRILGIMDDYIDILTGVAKPVYKEFQQEEEEIRLREKEEGKRRLTDFKAKEIDIRNREIREKNKRKQEFEKNMKNPNKNNVLNE
jgi:hypothetical protein